MICQDAWRAYEDDCIGIGGTLEIWMGGNMYQFCSNWSKPRRVKFLGANGPSSIKMWLISN